MNKTLKSPSHGCPIFSTFHSVCHSAEGTISECYWDIPSERFQDRISARTGKAQICGPETGFLHWSLRGIHSPALESERDSYSCTGARERFISLHCRQRGIHSPGLEASEWLIFLHQTICTLADVSAVISQWSSTFLLPEIQDECASSTCRESVCVCMPVLVRRFQLGDWSLQETTDCPTVCLAVSYIKAGRPVTSARGYKKAGGQ